MSLNHFWLFIYPYPGIILGSQFLLVNVFCMNGLQLKISAATGILEGT